MRPSSTTAVSTPRTRSPPTERAFLRAFSTTVRRGCPPLSSSAPGGSTRDSTPSCSRIARRWGEREARISGSGKLGEEETHLALGRLVRVGAMDEIGLHLEAEVAPDRAGRRLERVRRADHL